MADPAYIVDGVLTDGEAWVGIAHDSLSLPAATVTWESTDDGQTGDFSQYMDLVMVTYAKSDASAYETALAVVFNDDTTASIYERQQLTGNGAAVSAASVAGASLQIGQVAGSYVTHANTFGVIVTNLFDINSGKYKSVVSQSAADTNGRGNVYLIGGVWSKQAPITKIVLSDASAGDLMAGSTFSLFGVLPRMVA
tara:strand:+ start:772 stop:1359 length:588 start_codon:yes stop_codon:yes gene_type:complete